MLKLAALDRKLLRDLWQIKGQALAVASVIGAGVAMYVLMLSTFDSLELTRRTYYDRYRFGEIFAGLKRAPASLGARIAAIPGVAQVETRVVAGVTLDVPGLAEPAVGRLISIPGRPRPMLCDVFLRGGRYVEPGRDEVLASENFARAHGLEPGDTISAVINGRRRELRIAGLALSPEFVYTIRPGEWIPDDTRYGVFWMERRALATAFDMEGGFNDVVLTLMRGASEPEVLARLDALLKPYGGLGAIPRRLQPSHWYLANELTGLREMGRLVPIVFLAVAAFLLNVVLSRIVAVQREQIAAIKAVGYSNRAIALHYVKWSLGIAATGSAMGLVLGGWLGRGMTEMYTAFFHFPILSYRLSGSIAVQAVAISLIAAVLGGLNAVRRAVRLPPAEAMRPEPPATYRESLVERVGLKRWLTQPGRMIWRNLQRNPGRSLLSTVGIAAGGALLIFGSFSMDAMDFMMDIQFGVAQRYDVMVSFVEPTSSRAYYELKRLPGVIDVEPFRAVPVRLRHGHRRRQTAITGLAPEARLNRVIDTSLAHVRLPPEGLVLSEKLAELLDVEAGETVTVEVLEGRRPVHRVRVARLVGEYMGTNAYMDLDGLRRLMGEGANLSGAFLQVDEDRSEALYTELKRTPRVAGVSLKQAAIDSFDETVNEMMDSINAVNLLFATIIAFGVVYNSARISLSERSRELATLRVIGFTRAEISYILFGELAVITLMAVPLGMLAGYGLAAWMVRVFDTEMWRMPLVVAPRTYAYSAVAIVTATALSSLIVRRKLDRLDLVATLKTRE